MPDTILAKKSDITTLNADVNTEGSVLKSIKDNAENATYDNSTSGLAATTLGDAIDEVEGRVDDAEDSIGAIKGTGYTEGSLKAHEDRLDTLEGTGAGSVAKAIADAVSPIDERLSGLDTLVYEGKTYMVSKRIENGHLVTTYTEVV